MDAELALLAAASVGGTLALFARLAAGIREVCEPPAPPSPAEDMDGWACTPRALRRRVAERRN